MTYGSACACGHCGGSELLGTVVSLCSASVISVLCDEPFGGTGLTEFPDPPSNIGDWFAKSTACVTPLIESVLDSDRASLLTFSFFSMISARSIPDSFFQLLFSLVLRLLYLVVSRNFSCPTWNLGEALPMVRFSTSEMDPAWWVDCPR